jgi:hypothetical protein
MLAGLRSGDSAPLARAPRNSTLAMLVRDDPAARAQDATEVEGALAATLGPRLGAADAKRVHTALEDWTEARGDWATLAVALTPTGGAAVADVASPDPARASRGVREGLELLSRVPAIHDPFASWLHMRDLTFSAPDGPGGAHASMAVVTRVGASPFGLAWAAGEADLKLALAAEPLPLLAPPLPGETLGDDPTLRPLLASMGDVAGAIVAQPGRSPGCTAAGGLVFAWGARADGAGAQVLRGQLASPYSSLRCLAKTLF